MYSLPLKVREGNLKESIIYCFFTQLICVCFTSVQTHGAEHRHSESKDHITWVKASLHCRIDL